MTATLPPYVSRDIVAERLPRIFPKGAPNRQYCVRELAASTVFVMLYIGAVEGAGQFLGPIHVYRMTDEQAAQSEDRARLDYAVDVLRRDREVPGTRWYADNTREPIRDETLREGLVSVGAVIARDDLPTTSSKPRYALRQSFAGLFDPKLTGRRLFAAIASWRDQNLSSESLARISLMRHGAAGNEASVLVALPNGETRQLTPGPSSRIAKAVVEVFAARFLESPVLLWLSESGKKVVARFDEMAKSIGLQIQPDRDLPDMILADLGSDKTIIVFVEIVATDGAITDRRKAALYRLTDNAGFNRSNVAFITAYEDRDSPGFKKTISSLAWGSFAWFVSEPYKLLIMRDGNDWDSTQRLADLLPSP